MPFEALEDDIDNRSVNHKIFRKSNLLLIGAIILLSFYHVSHEVVISPNGIDYPEPDKKKADGFRTLIALRPPGTTVEFEAGMIAYDAGFDSVPKEFQKYVVTGNDVLRERITNIFDIRKIVGSDGNFVDNSINAITEQNIWNNWRRNQKYPEAANEIFLANIALDFLIIFFIVYALVTGVRAFRKGIYRSELAEQPIGVLEGNEFIFECDECGYEVDEDDKRCPKCGANIEEIDEVDEEEDSSIPSENS